MEAVKDVSVWLEELKLEQPAEEEEE